MSDIIIKEISISSINICFGPAPGFDEEVEQDLIISSTGQVWFTGYNYSGGNGAKTMTRKLELNIGFENVCKIFYLFAQYFKGSYIINFATDVGDWKLTIIDIDQREYKFNGSLCGDLYVENIGLSAYLRDQLPIGNLFVFDGKVYDDEEEEDDDTTIP